MIFRGVCYIHLQLYKNKGTKNKRFLGNFQPITVVDTHSICPFLIFRFCWPSAEAIQTLEGQYPPKAVCKQTNQDLYNSQMDQYDVFKVILGKWHKHRGPIAMSHRNPFKVFWSWITPEARPSVWVLRKGVRLVLFLPVWRQNFKIAWASAPFVDLRATSKRPISFSQFFRWILSSPLRCFYNFTSSGQTVFRCISQAANSWWSTKKGAEHPDRIADGTVPSQPFPFHGNSCSPVLWATLPPRHAISEEKSDGPWGRYPSGGRNLCSRIFHASSQYGRKNRLNWIRRCEMTHYIAGLSSCTVLVWSQSKLLEKFWHPNIWHMVEEKLLLVRYSSVSKLCITLSYSARLHQLGVTPFHCQFHNNLFIFVCLVKDPL